VGLGWQYRRRCKPWKEQQRRVRYDHLWPFDLRAAGGDGEQEEQGMTR
jgi:hypothetical protein